MRTTLTVMLTILMAHVAHAAELNQATIAKVGHVALVGSGDLVGQVIAPQGSALAEKQLQVRHDGVVIAKATTDKDGGFVIHNLKPGTYEIQLGTQLTSCQLWAPGTAPPSAHPAVLVVNESDTVRGQDDGNFLRNKKFRRRALAIGGAGAGLFWALDYNRKGS